MDKKNLQKLTEIIKEELVEIDKELSSIASENPMVKGDFDVRVEDIGSSLEDAAQEASELDRIQPQVDNLERRRKEIVVTLDKIEKGTFGE